MGGTPKQIGGYEILSRLGQGGMGSVYRARDPRTGREVAIKVLRRPEAVTEAKVRRFRREGRVLARLQHPNLVRLIETGITDEAPYLVTEVVEGEDLGERLRRAGPLDDLRTAEIGLALAGALAASHELGIVHRDLKPANVILRPDGSPVLTDFGIAKDVDVVETARRLTATGVFVGTPGFWSPEQVRAEPDSLGPWTDVYGLGATLYALRAGAPPFEGPLLEVLGATLEQAPLSLVSVAGASPAFDAIVQRCLAKEPGDRYGSMQALAEDLTHFADQSLPTSSGGWHKPALLTVVVVLVLGGLAALASNPGPAPAPSSTSSPRSSPTSSQTPSPTTSQTSSTASSPAPAPRSAALTSANPTPTPTGSADRRYLAELITLELPPGEPSEWGARAEAREGRACLALGVAHWTGRGAPLDYERAQHLLRLAADLGEPYAEHFVGEAHAVGKGAPRNQALAFEHTRRAAVAGYARAQTTLAHLYRLGTGVAQDLAEMHRWLEAAAEQEFPEALSSLGFMRQHGVGVPPDPEGAIGLYRRAAELGSSTGMLNLGESYRTGTGVPRDPAEAMRWWEQAARRGNVLAMASLGHGHRDGLGGEVDLEQARHWLREAADRGHRKARYTLQVLDEER